MDTLTFFQVNKGYNVNKVIYKGLTRSQMVSMIHMETDTSFWCYNTTDEELIEGFREVFGEEYPYGLRLNACV